MILEGVVTNVTNFGAFIDIGIHQDGLVHISALADKFVKDPREIVKAGDIVKVKVMDIDIDRKRIGLTMRLNDSPSEKARDIKRDKPSGSSRKNKNVRQNGNGNRNNSQPTPGNSAMADALAKAMNKTKK